MISTLKSVRLRWLSPAERGRKAPPQGSRYFATIRFDAAPFADEEWSVRLDDLQSSGGGSEAVVSFVSDRAPLDALQPGVRFQLFEGRWPVAEGFVV